MNIPAELRKLRESLERELIEIDRSAEEHIAALHANMRRRREVVAGLSGITEELAKIERERLNDVNY